jgi:hypothetical protein
MRSYRQIMLEGSVPRDLAIRVPQCCDPMALVMPLRPMLGTLRAPPIVTPFQQQRRCEQRDGHAPLATGICGRLHHDFPRVVETTAEQFLAAYVPADELPA